MLATYWRATCSFSFPASIVPVLLGTALAAGGYGGNARAFHIGVFLLTLLGAVLAHAGANVINDYFDFVNKVDTKPEHGSGILTQNLLTKSQVLTFGLALLAGAALCGLAVFRGHETVVLTLALIGLGCAVLYPAVLKRFALGDLLIIIAFGVGLTLGAYGVQVSSMTAHQWGLVSLVSLPVCLLVDAILHANNIRDRDDDNGARVATIATLLSPQANQRFQAFLLFFPILFLIGGIAFGLLPVGSLMALIAVPMLLKAYKTGIVPLTAAAHMVFGLPYALSFVLMPHFL